MKSSSAITIIFLSLAITSPNLGFAAQVSCKSLLRSDELTRISLDKEGWSVFESYPSPFEPSEIKSLYEILLASHEGGNISWSKEGIYRESSSRSHISSVPEVKSALFKVREYYQTIVDDLNRSGALETKLQLSTVEIRWSEAAEMALIRDKTVHADGTFFRFVNVLDGKLLEVKDGDEFVSIPNGFTVGLSGLQRTRTKATMHRGPLKNKGERRLLIVGEVDSVK